MRTAIISAVITLALIAVSIGSYRRGKTEQQAADAPKINELINQVAQLRDARDRDAKTISKLRYEAKTNAWEKYFAAEEQIKGLQFANHTMIAAFVACDAQRREIERARSAQQTQGMEAALKILALLLR